MTESRNISKSLAPLLELLELEQPRVVTTSDLAEAAAEVGLQWAARDIARRLLEKGWLLPLKTRGVWEFAPAARAGAIGAGDPFIELRATLRRRPDAPFAVAAESAAYLLGLSGRQPDPEVIAAPPATRIPDALSEFRLVRWQPKAALLTKDGLPTWSPETLLAFMSSKPARFRDWPNVPEWIVVAFQSIDPDALHHELQNEARSAWMRAAYLAERAGDRRVSQRLLENAPEGVGPYRLTVREEPGRYFARFEMVDSIDRWTVEE